MNLIALPINVISVVFLLTACTTADTTAENSSSQTSTSSDTSMQTEISSPQTPVVKDISAEEFNDLITAGGVQILDVRTPEEFSAGHITGAMNIDFQNASFEDSLGSLDKATPALVYCALGGRSSKAAKRMTELGFTTVYNLTGGYDGWPYK